MPSAAVSSITEKESEELLSTLVRRGNVRARHRTGRLLQGCRLVRFKTGIAGFQPGSLDGSWYQGVPFIKLSTQPDQCYFQVGDEEAIAGKAAQKSVTSRELTGVISLSAMACIAKERPPR